MKVEHWDIGRVRPYERNPRKNEAAVEELRTALKLGPARIAVYEMVRQSVDDFEKTAPWKLLYYPPEDPEAFLALLTSLVELIQGIPKRVAGALDLLLAAVSVVGAQPPR